MPGPSPKMQDVNKVNQRHLVFVFELPHVVTIIAIIHSLLHGSSQPMIVCLTRLVLQFLSKK